MNDPRDLWDIPKAQQLFNPTNDPHGVQITAKGKRHLGAVLGSIEFREEYIRNEVSKWTDDIKSLSEIAKSKLQNANAVFTKAIAHRWTYVQRTVPELGHLFEPLWKAISLHLIPAIIG